MITDNQFPYHVYGAQQDSGTVVVPSRTNHHEIDARDWYTVSAGEAGYIAVDPKNHNIVYAGNTAGSLARFDKRTWQAQNITPGRARSFGNPSTRNTAFRGRRRWSSRRPNPSTLYFGAQVLLKTIDGGLQLAGDLRRPDRRYAQGQDAGGRSGHHGQRARGGLRCDLHDRPFAAARRHGVGAAAIPA